MSLHHVFEHKNVGTVLYMFHHHLNESSDCDISFSTHIVLSSVGDKDSHVHLCLQYAFCVLQDCSSVQPKPECGLHCGYLACLPAGDHTRH